VTGTTYDMGGYLTNTNGAVTGTLHTIEQGANCYQIDQAIPITGTITTDGTVSLTSAAVANQIFSVRGDVLGGVLDGTYAISGGCAAGESGTVIGELMPSLTGTYTGTFYPASGAFTGATITVTQSGPNADGEFSLPGTASFSGSPCFTTGTVTSSTVFGEYIQVTIGTDKGGVVQFTGLAAAVGSDDIFIDGSYAVTAGTCAGDTGSGVLNSS
jgi:hypothetical protein